MAAFEIVLDEFDRNVDKSKKLLKKTICYEAGCSTKSVYREFENVNNAWNNFKQDKHKMLDLYYRDKTDGCYFILWYEYVYSEDGWNKPHKILSKMITESYGFYDTEKFKERMLKGKFENY